MFQFGLFSTFIPYLFIAIAYLSFIGNIALHKNQYIDYEGLPSRYEISKTTTIHQTSFQYSTKKNKVNTLNNFSSYLLKSNINLPKIQLNKEPDFADEFDVRSKLIKASLFTRPPPIV